MTLTARAIYEAGRLRPLGPIPLEGGQQVNVVITPVAELSAEEIDARLRSAGLLAEIDIPEDAVELSSEERERIGRLFVGLRPSEELIDEDRGTF